MDSPADGEELARVVPLRRRDRELTAAPGARGSLPRERAPFDPEIEPNETLSRRRPPRTVSLHVRRSASRFRRVPRPLDDTHATPSRRYPPAVLLTGVAGASVATVAALGLLASILNPSPPAPAAQIQSLGRGVVARALAQTRPGLLTAGANPFGATGDAAARRTGRTAATRAPHSRPKSTRHRPTHHHAGGGTLSINHQSAVVASYTPGTSARSDRPAVSDTRSPAITTSTSPRISVSDASTVDQSFETELELRFEQQ